MKEVEPEMFFR